MLALVDCHQAVPVFLQFSVFPQAFYLNSIWSTLFNVETSVADILAISLQVPGELSWPENSGSVESGCLSLGNHSKQSQGEDFELTEAYAMTFPESNY